MKTIEKYTLDLKDKYPNIKMENITIILSELYNHIDSLEKEVNMILNVVYNHMDKLQKEVDTIFSEVYNHVDKLEKEVESLKDK